MKAVRFLFLIIGLIILDSCALYTKPELTKVSGLKFKKMEGRQFQFELETTVNNPNWYAIKLKRSAVDVFVEQATIGRLTLNSTLRYAKKQQSTCTAPLTAQLADGALITLLRYAGKQSVKVSFKGKVRAGVWFFSKKINVDTTFSVAGNQLKIGIP